jgi:hypothetical protein
MQRANGTLAFLKKSSGPGLQRSNKEIKTLISSYNKWKNIGLSKDAIFNVIKEDPIYGETLKSMTAKAIQSKHEKLGKLKQLVFDASNDADAPGWFWL